MAKYAKPTPEPARNSPPATTVEGREAQMVNLAMDLAEKRLKNGTASAQEVTHFLKLGTANARLEREILESERDLKKAKTESLNSQKKVEELYEAAIRAFRDYSGAPVDDND